MTATSPVSVGTVALRKERREHDHARQTSAAVHSARSRRNRHSCCQHDFICVVSVSAGLWEIRRQVQKDLLPRKHRLEALLKELDAP